MKSVLLLFVVSFFTLSSQAQSYSISKIETNVNGNKGAMKGVPGDLFTALLTFSNSSASTINVFIDRYKNNIPAYWGVCYCYIQCHDRSQDTLTIEIQPNSTTIVSLLFKTDSVNPGVAYDSFKIHQIGFQSNPQNLDLTASTMSEVGIRENKNMISTLQLFPNPSSNEVTISVDEEIRSLKVYDVLGQLKSEIKNVNSADYKLAISNYPQGSYFVEVHSEKNKYIKNFIKN